MGTVYELLGFGDDEPILKLDASKWKDLAGASAALCEACGQKSPPKKGGAAKMASDAVKAWLSLCESGALVVIGKAEAKAGLVVHLLECLQEAIEQVEEAGALYVVLEGFGEEVNAQVGLGPGLGSLL